MKAMFRKIAGDDGVVDAKELQSILNTVYMNGSLFQHVIGRFVSCVFWVNSKLAHSDMYS